MWACIHQIYKLKNALFNSMTLRCLVSRRNENAIDSYSRMRLKVDTIKNEYSLYNKSHKYNKRYKE